MNSLFSHFIQRFIPVVFLLFGQIVFASSSPETTIQQRFREYLGVDVKKETIVKTPYSGLYEVQIGNNLVYTDKQAQYLFVGRIMDLQTKKDYTDEKLRRITIVNFSELAKDVAIQIVKGNGKGKIAVFSDPNCRYCKQLEYNLRNVDDVTIYLYPYNILSEKSVEISRNVWCSGNPAQAWKNWMINDKMPEKAKNDCTFPDKKIRELGQKLNIKGTPTIFFTDGTRVPGAADADEINRKLKSLP